MNELQMAKKLIVSLHGQQTDKAGRPYVEHLYAVARQFSDPTMQTIALLHDSIEDTDTTAETLKSMGFSTRVVSAVVALTKKVGEAYEEYLLRVKNNSDARQIKIADLRHNMDMSRLPQITEKDLLRQEKYEQALRYLSSHT